ncbi:MAG: deoxyuridine 5'-triphosphate nucleotidohydrolase, partial [Dehalococcoidia bacterium]
APRLIGGDGSPAVAAIGGMTRFVSRGALGPAPGERTIARHEALSPPAGDTLELGPGPYLVTFNEVVAIPNHLMALGRPRSSLLRSGVAIHTAVWDPGYHGRSQALMVVYNPLGYRLAPGAPILQLVFFPLASPVAEGYRGIFQGENTG